MRNKIRKNILIAFFMLLCVIFVIKFGSSAILRLYVETGLGNCQKIPVLCIRPYTEIVNPVINEKYLYELPCSELSGIQICTPKEFKIIKQKITKVYYVTGRNNYEARGSAIYLLYEKPDFFINLFPSLKRQGINNDYEFIAREIYASMNEIHNLTDAFFVIMKSILTPDLGDQKNVKMSKFTSKKFKGFISYNLGILENYFDCNIFDLEGNFYKIYIKDSAKQLDVDKVLAIISTIKKVS